MLELKIYKEIALDHYHDVLRYGILTKAKLCPPTKKEKNVVVFNNGHCSASNTAYAPVFS